MKLYAKSKDSMVGDNEFVVVDPGSLAAEHWAAAGYVPQSELHGNAAAADAIPSRNDWTLKTKSPEDYVAEHGETPEDELSPSVAENLALARSILAAEAEAQAGSPEGDSE